MTSGLIIDDNRLQHQTLRPALSLALGQEPDSVYTLAAADQMLSKKSYDYIIVDLLTEQLAACLNLLLSHKAKNTIKLFCTLLVISTETGPQLITACADLDVDSLLLKPIKTSEFITRLTDSLSKKNTIKAPLLALERSGATIETFKLFDDSLKAAHTPSQKKQALRTQAFFFASQKKYPQALQTLGKLRLICDTPKTHLLIAQVLLESGQQNKSIDVIEQILAANPNLIAGYDLLAEAQYQQGAGLDALRSRRKANDLNPLNAQRSSKLSSEAYNLGDLELAQKTLEFQLHNIVSPGEADDDRLALLARVLLAQDKTQEGLLVLGKTRKSHETPGQAGSPQVMITLLWAAIKQKEEANALDLLRQLMRTEELDAGPKPYLSEAALCAYWLSESQIGDHWLERALLRQSLSFSQFQKIKDEMSNLGLAENLLMLSRRAAQTRASQIERARQFQAAGLFMEIAQDMIEYTEHPDADINSLIDTLESIMEADKQGQLHQAATLVVEKLQSRIKKLGPSNTQKARIDFVMRQITLI